MYGINYWTVKKMACPAHTTKVTTDMYEWYLGHRPTNIYKFLGTTHFTPPISWTSFSLSHSLPLSPYAYKHIHLTFFLFLLLSPYIFSSRRIRNHRYSYYCVSIISAGEYGFRTPSAAFPPRTQRYNYRNFTTDRVFRFTVISLTYCLGEIFFTVKVNRIPIS